MAWSDKARQAAAAARRAHAKSPSKKSIAAALDRQRFRRGASEHVLAKNLGMRMALHNPAVATPKAKKALSDFVKRMSTPLAPKRK